jgi:phosphatidylethanolamine-binding protein (PEBP) family uncharacterized protein
MAKVASAGFVLALATAVVLGVSGCGGDSSDGQTESTTRSVAKEAPNAVTDEAKGAKSKGPSRAEEERDEAAAKVKTDTAAGGTSAGKGKHGPSIAQPKGEPEPTATPQQKAETTAVSMSLSSPVLSGPESPLPSAYTCDGKDSWPEIAWGGIPPGTAELALLAMNIQPVNEQIFFDWAVGGIDPGLSGLEAGRLPKGAVLGKNSFGQNAYSICPPKGSGETYMFALYALPKALGPKKGFDPLALREQALGISGDAGLLATTYSRR